MRAGILLRRAPGLVRPASSLIGARRSLSSVASNVNQLHHYSKDYSKVADELGDAHAVWEEIWDEAAHQFKRQSWKSGDLQEFGMDLMLHNKVMRYKTLACGLAHTIGGKLQANNTDDKDHGVDFVSILRSALQADPAIRAACAADLRRFRVVDPAVSNLLEVYLFFKGVQAIALQRVAHHYWTSRGEAGKLIARMLQSEMSDVYGVDIHPACKMGWGITIDHATGVVIGETTTLGDNVYIMHDVTLGATGTSATHDRHPKVGNNVFLGAKCTVLGNVQIGDGATIAAAAVVTKEVPSGCTAVGVPAKILPPLRRQSPEVIDVSPENGDAHPLLGNVK